MLVVTCRILLKMFIVFACVQAVFALNIYISIQIATIYLHMFNSCCKHNLKQCFILIEHNFLQLITAYLFYISLGLQS